MARPSAGGPWLMTQQPPPAQLKFWVWLLLILEKVRDAGVKVLLPLPLLLGVIVPLQVLPDEIVTEQV